MHDSLVKRLFDNSTDVTARRDCWPEGDFIFANWGKIIENKDIEKTLVFDSRLKHFLQGGELNLSRAIFKYSAIDKVVEPFVPSPRDYFAQDWVTTDYSDLNTIKEWKDSGLEFDVDKYESFKKSKGFDLGVPLPRDNIKKSLKEFKKYLEGVVH